MKPQASPVIFFHKGLFLIPPHWKGSNASLFWRTSFWFPGSYSQYIFASTTKSLPGSRVLLSIKTTSFPGHPALSGVEWILFPQLFTLYPSTCSPWCSLLAFCCPHRERRDRVYEMPACWQDEASVDVDFTTLTSHVPEESWWGKHPTVPPVAVWTVENVQCGATHVSQAILLTHETPSGVPPLGSQIPATN